jgi:hypothetical protein
VTHGSRGRGPCGHPEHEQQDSTGQTRETQVERPRLLTLHQRSGGLDDNVRNLLDWLVDEELRRWQREEQ